jgi:two-component system, NarL family, response regulator NreC
MISILLADDHPVVRRGLRAVLEGETDFRVTGETGDGLEAVRLVEELRPQVLVLDLMMPGVGGLEVARQVNLRFPTTKVVILSMHANEAYVLEALRNGASAYVLKDAGGGELLQAVRSVVAGSRYLSPPLSERAIADYVEKAKSAPLDPVGELTTREREVLGLAAEGQSTGDIAARLGISPRTAETHRANLMRKLGLHSQTDLVRFAIRQGILPPE